MRASIRGSIRNVMVTDSDPSALPEMAVSINRRAGRFSDQKSASASSLSKIGTSSQLAKVRISQKYFGPGLSGRKRLVHFSLVKKPFFRIEPPGVEDADRFPVRPINADHTEAAR